MQHAATLASQPGLYRVDKQFFNIINRLGEFSDSIYLKSIIVPDGTFKSSYHGHHFCEMGSGSEYRPCDFAYVHYHYKPLEMLREHARAKLAPFVDVDDRDAVASFTGAGHHLRTYLTMTEQEFNGWHGGGPGYNFSEFNELLNKLGSPIPI